LRRAIELGVDHIDTSQYYGPDVVNELIREALHPYPENLKPSPRWALELTDLACIRGARDVGREGMYRLRLDRSPGSGEL
jgi:hypothetical protein